MKRPGSDFDQWTQEPSSVDGPLIDLGRLISALQRFWLPILAFLILSVGLTIVALSRMTPIFAASAMLEVSQQERNIVDVAVVENVVADREFLNTQIELLRSDSLAEDVIVQLDLIDDPFIHGMTPEEWNALDTETQMRTSIRKFHSNLSVTSVGRSRLIEVSFEHTSPNRAASVANGVADVFIENKLSNKVNTTLYAKDFLEDRLDQVRQSLQEAERELVSYASENSIFLVGNDDNQNASESLDGASLLTIDQALETARTNFVKARAALREAEQSDFTQDILTSPTISKLKEEQIALNSEYIDKLATFKPSYPDMIELKSRIDLYDETIESESQAIRSGRLEDARVAFSVAQTELSDLEGRLDELKTSVLDFREKGIQYNILRRQVETERAQYEALLQRLKEVSVADDLSSSLVTVVDPARAPQVPAKPNKPRTLLLIFMVCLILSVGVAYLFDLIDDNVADLEDVKSKLNRPLLGIIPKLKSNKEIVKKLADPQTEISEAYSSVVTSIRFSSPNGGPRVVQVTSTRSGEGKSVSSLGIATRLAGIGFRTLLIDADMRIPTFKGSDVESGGLSGLLTSNDRVANAAAPSYLENLRYIATGRQVPNPSELLSNNRFSDIIEEARGEFDYVIIDSPPVLGIADAPVIGARVDATILVVESNRLRTPKVLHSIRRLRQSGSNVMGVVLTKHKPRMSAYQDGYAYSYSYGNKKSSKLSRREREHRKNRQLDIGS